MSLKIGIIIASINRSLSNLAYLAHLQACTKCARAQVEAILTYLLIYESVVTGNGNLQ